MSGHLMDDVGGKSGRAIFGRWRGDQHGPIARLISPDALGERLKPFIFLDHFNAEIEPGFGFGMHPHSGIATLTWQPGSDVRYQDTTGQNGVLKAGGLEWMNAGGGAFHRGELLGHGRVTGFQLWVPMPPDLEDGPAFGQYAPPQDVRSLNVEGGSITVLLGEVREGDGLAKSPIQSPHDMAYFVVALAEGAAWRYAPPPQHDVAWAYGFEGQPAVQGADFNGDLLVFSGTGPLAFSAPHGPARILVGTASRYPYPLVLGRSSVHSNARSLKMGERRIGLLRQELAAAGRL
jgi:redox-sensitive bicupin YhaK (pirin superfamily)